MDDDDLDHKEHDIIEVSDDRGRAVPAVLWLDVTLQSLWDCALSAIKKVDEAQI